MIIRSRPRILCASALRDVELERFRQRPNGLADLLLREQTVAERVPAPRGRRPLLDVCGEQRFDLGEPAVAYVPLDRCHARRVVGRRLRPGQRVETILCRRGAGIQFHRLAVGGYRPFRVPLLLEDGAEVLLRIRRGGLHAARRDGTRVAASSSSPRSSAARPSAMSRLAFWVRSAAAMSSPALLELDGRLVLPSGTRQRQTQLIVRLAAGRIEPDGFLQLGDRVGHVSRPGAAPCRARSGPGRTSAPGRSPSAAARSLSPIRASSWRRRPSRD